MILNSTDILNIQSAIDRYEKRFPRRPSPSADDALAWQAGKRRSLQQSNARVSELIAPPRNLVPNLPVFQSLEAKVCPIKGEERVRWSGQVAYAGRGLSCDRSNGTFTYLRRRAAQGSHMICSLGCF
jgi:hypothetical protein